MPVPRIFPTVTGDLKCTADAAGSQYHRLRVKQLETAPLAIIGKSADAARTVLQQGEDGVLGVEIDSLMDAVVLQRADHLQAGPVADVGQTGIAMAAEVPLQDLAI